MTYSVKEAYYTLQGEGINAGRAAVFLRFTGCNLWSGREGDRLKGTGGCAAWCDTDFVGTDGHGGGRFKSAAELAAHVERTWDGGPAPERLVVCTGGEPALQLNEALVTALHERGFRVAVETNGTRPLPRGVDWVCVSPKAGAELVVRQGHELKFVYPQDGLEPHEFECYAFDHLFLQPKDDFARIRHTRAAIEYCLAHPRWRLTIQAHKYLGVP